MEIVFKSRFDKLPNHPLKMFIGASFNAYSSTTHNLFFDIIFINFLIDSGIAVASQTSSPQPYILRSILGSYPSHLLEWSLLRFGLLFFTLGSLNISLKLYKTHSKTTQLINCLHFSRGAFLDIIEMAWFLKTGLFETNREIGLNLLKRTTHI